MKWITGIAGNVVPTWESESDWYRSNWSNWMDTPNLDLDVLWICFMGIPFKRFFSFSLSFLFLFLSFKFTIFNHTHAPCVHSSVYLPINNYNNNHAPLCSASTTTTTSCNPTCCQTIIKILLDACWTLNNGSKCTHPPLSLFSPYLSLSPNAPPPPPTTTTTMRRTDSKARHSRWCWWSLNIPLRRHSPSQMFVTIFSFVFYFPYIFMFRANWNNYPFFQNQKTTTLLYCQYNFELAKFSFIIS